MQTDSTATGGVNDLPQEILTRLDALAHRLGVGAEHIYGVLVRQAYVEAVQSALLLAVAVSLVWVTCWKWSGLLRWRLDSPYENTRLNNGRTVVLVAVVVVVAFFAFIAAVSAANTIPTALMNPEYYALEEIKDALND